MKNKTIEPTISQLRALAMMRGEFWAIRPEDAQALALDAMEPRANLGDPDFFNLRHPLMMDPDGIAHIQIRGALMNRFSAIHERSGLVTGYSTITREVQGAVEAGARAIMFSIDSPGGTVAGLRECAEGIFSSAIPTLAFCSGLACSAAYKLASQCTGIAATSSAIVGNIGTILAWVDCSKFWEDMGIEFKALTSEGADLKSTFHLEPDEKQLAFLQEQIDEAGRDFVEAVKSGRGRAGVEMNAEVWRAGWYSGEKAKSFGLIDELASFQNARAELLRALNGENNS